MKTNNHYSRAFLAVAPAIVLLLSLAGTVIPAQAQTYNVVADIPNVPGVENPSGQKIVQGRNGDLFLTANGGEDSGVDSLTLTGTDTKLADIFRGASPGVTLGTDGNLYSTAPLGGSGTCGFYGCGYVWNVTPSGTFTTLYSFTGTPDGCNPNTPLVQAPSGIFYGTTPS